MAIGNGLLGNPVIQGLLSGGGPAGIRDLKRKQLFDAMKGNPGGRFSAPTAIQARPDESMGKGLSALGTALGDIANMKKQAEAKEAFAELYAPEDLSEEDSLAGAAPVAPNVTSQKLATFLAKYPDAGAVTKNAMNQLQTQLGNETRKDTQNFQEKLLGKTQSFTASEAGQDRRLKKDMQDNKIAAENLSGFLNRSSKLKIAMLSRDARVEAAQIGASANKNNKTASLMTYGEFRAKSGSIGLTGGKEKYNDSDPMMVTLNSDGTLSGAKFLDNQQVVTNVGMQDKQVTFEAGKTPAQELTPKQVLPKTNRDMKGAVGLITGSVLSALDRIGSGIGITSGDTAAAADFVENVNKRVTATGAIISQVMKRNGKESNYTRELTASILPKRGLFDGEISFQNELNTTIQNLKNARAEMLGVVNDGSYSVQDRNVAKQQIVAMQTHIFEYEDMLGAMKPKDQKSNLPQLILDADSVVGRGVN
jgi:hypothetical protein